MALKVLCVPIAVAEGLCKRTQEVLCDSELCHGSYPAAPHRVSVRTHHSMTSPELSASTMPQLSAYVCLSAALPSTLSLHALPRTRMRALTDVLFFLFLSFMLSLSTVVWLHLCICDVGYLQRQGPKMAGSES